MKYRVGFLNRIAIVAFAVVAAACGTDSVLPTAPRTLETPAANAAVSSGLSLSEQLELENERIALAQEYYKPVYDALKQVWAQLLLAPASVRNVGPFLPCDPLPYVGQARIIGSEGGTIDFGPHKLIIPRYALKAKTVITAEAPTSLKVEAKFSPHGTQFDLKYPPTLVLSYKHCQGLTTVLPTKIVYVNDYYQILELPVSQLNKYEKLVQAKIKHFSGYVVAW